MRTEFRLPNAFRLAGYVGLAGLAGIFAFAPLPLFAQTYRVLHDFCSKANCADGLGPTGLMMDNSGHYYGAAGRGGAYGQGAVFELIPEADRWKVKILHSFCAQQNCTDGANPDYKLMVDTAGNLYGTTQLVSDTEGGIVFKLAPNARRTRWKFQILYTFCALANCGDGSDPVAGITYAGQANGKLYDGVSPLFGTTLQGGATRCLRAATQGTEMEGKYAL
ncbi:MAG: choice-of-anchor tandem repeat GloVer-containing protein [Rhizomicrobium sp.]